MPKRFLTPIELLSGDPTSPLFAAPKQYVDKRGAPAGGSIGQVLLKTGAADHAMAWANAPGVGGIVDCSAMATVSEINAASLTAGAGALIWTGARRTTPLQIDTTWIVRPNQKIMGPGGRQANGRAAVTAGFPAGQPLMAAQGYLNNGSAADNPVCIEGIALEAGGKVGSDGLVVYNFWSHFEDIQVTGVAGPHTVGGIRATDRGINGSTVSSNSHSENTFVRCRFDSFTQTASGFIAESNSGISNQDGHLSDCFVSSVGGYGIQVGRSAGWTIQNNHLYGIGYDGISTLKNYATKIINNYVEDFGRAEGANNGSAPTYGYFNGISMGEVLDTRGSVLALNTVSTDQPSSSAANQFTCYYARAGASQVLANLVCVGNVATFAKSTAPSPSKSRAFRFGEGGDTGRTLVVEWAANLIQPVAWWTSTRSHAAGTVVINEPASAVHAANHAPGAGDDLSTWYLNLTGNQTVGGDKTFSGNAVFSGTIAVPVGTANAHPVRRDDARLVADAAATQASVRTIGTGALQAAAGNHTHAGGATSGFATGTVPSGSTLPVISHGLGTLNINVVVQEVSTGLIVPVTVEAISTTQARLTFRTAPASGQYSYFVLAGPATVSSNVPKVTGPFIPGSAIAASALSAGPKSLATISVPDLGFDWEPLCFAEIEMRTDISGSRPALQVREGSVNGVAYANGVMSTETTAYTMVQAIPIAGATPVLSAGARTLHLVAVNAYGGGWIQTTTLSAQFAVWAIPA